MTAIYPLSLLQRNDEDVLLQFSSAGQPFPLDKAMTVELYIKPAQTVADDDIRTLKLTSEAGEIEIVDRGTGACIAHIPASATAAAGTFWYHVDAVKTGGRPRKTNAHRPLIITTT